MGISKNDGNWHLEAFLCYFTCLNLIFVKILGNFQLGHHYYCLLAPIVIDWNNKYSYSYSYYILSETPAVVYQYKKNVR
jgi:hypothetical protein